MSKLWNLGGHTKRERKERPIFILGKTVVLDSVFCVAKGIIELESKGVFVEALIKNQCCQPKGVPVDLIGTHFEYKEVGGVGMIEVRTENNNF